MAKQKISVTDVLRLGQQGAALKASMTPKRWKKFVKSAHERGFTVRSAASDAPDALRERTSSALQKEAQSTIAKMYAPATKELTQRDAAIGFLDQKRAEDEAKYRQWLMGETEKLEAQARAADGALTTQQQTIASEHEAATKAAMADTLKRMGAVPGVVSDPNQSTALASTTEADEASRAHIANARTLTADLSKIGEDSRQLARSSLIAQQGAREASRVADTQKARGEISSDRRRLVLEQASDAAKLLQDLVARNVEITQGGREFDLAATELGHKQDALAADVAEANRKFRLEQKKFKLDRFIANNRILVDQAKIKLGYDQIEAREGKQEADAALRRWVEKYKARKKSEENAKDRKADPKKGGITQDERDLYSDVSTAFGILKRMHEDFTAGNSGAIHPNDMRQHLRKTYGVSDVMIDIAEDMRRHNGRLSAAGRAKARRLGIKHVGYFFGK